MTLDLLILMLSYLPATEAQALFEACLSTEILEAKDNAVQKRGYKILAKLMEGGKVTVDAQAVIQKLDALLEGLSPAAKKVYCSVTYSSYICSCHLVGSFHSPHPAGRSNPADQSPPYSVDHTRGCSWY